ncbi:MAG: OB-fold nucleic acid binding domain-containing protein [Methanotrichaceae archaeon]|nr:OB-fold nucleic acid binding domain-containing protein [Methanotrichaceae archaeon]
MVEMEEELAEIFKQIENQVSPEEFEVRIEEKVSLLAGLCDRRTAAMLVARELGVSEVVTKISRIRPESGTVTFTGRIISMSDIREFVRNDGSTGRVANLTLGDETGTIRVTLWDEAADMVKSGQINLDQCYKVLGLAKEGLKGTEISLGRTGNIQEVDEDIRPRREPYKISEIGRDMGEVSLIAKVLDPGKQREFMRKDGSVGIVSTVLLGDETGKIRITLWNDQAKMDLKEGDVLEIINGSSAERYGQLEIRTSGYTIIRKSDQNVSYSEKISSIADLKPGNLCSVSGFVTGLGEMRAFQREDGTPGQVANIYISDATGRIKVVLWGEHADLLEKLDLGYKADIIDCQAKSGWNEELELSCNWLTRITFSPPT